MVGPVRLIVIVVAVLLGVIAPARADDSIGADRIERARQGALDSDYQPKLPRYEAGSGEGGGALEGGGSGGLPRDRMGPGPRRRGNGNIYGRDEHWVDTRNEPHREQQMSGFMQMVLWGMLIVLVILAAVWVGSELTKYGGDAEVPPGESQVRMQAAVEAILEKPLGDADELARRGEYAEAIHTLLLRTLQELVRSAAVRVAPATTSREILARVPLLADARTALAGLITAVEITHFGDEPANADDYERCRNQFHVFATAFRLGAQGPQVVAA